MMSRLDMDCSLDLRYLWMNSKITSTITPGRTWYEGSEEDIKSFLNKYKELVCVHGPSNPKGMN